MNEGARWPSAVRGGAVVEWVRALAWTGGTGRVRIPLRQLCFRILAIPFTPLCQHLSFRGDTKSCRSRLSGVNARGSKRSHQSAPVGMCNCRGLHHTLYIPASLWHWRTAPYRALPIITQDKKIQTKLILLTISMFLMPTNDGPSGI